MRISDWISDVCSSDLATVIGNGYASCRKSASAPRTIGEIAMGNQPDIRAGRLPDSAYAENFGDVHPPLDRKAALVEASRCYFCYDAPCIEACPTGIDIPSFIRKISTDNVRGATQELLEGKERKSGGQGKREEER